MTQRGADRREQHERAVATHILLNRLVDLVDQLPPAERETITQLAKETAREFTGMGERHALELIYRLGQFLNEHSPRRPE